MKSSVFVHGLLRAFFIVCACAALGTTAEAQIVTGTIFGSGYGLNPGDRDSRWKIVAVPSGYTPDGGQSIPYNSYVTYSVPSVGFIGRGTPQPGVVTGTVGGVPVTNYWITPSPTTGELKPFPTNYNWIAQQTFTVPQTGFYRFDFPAAGDNEIEFYIDGSINTSNGLKPTITGGQQIGGKAGGFGALTTFTGGAELSAGTHTASMVLWDYGFETAALIGSSTFAPTVAYWAPSTDAGGNGTWNNSNSFWTPSADGSGTKLPWTSGVGVAYFGGTSGTVSVGENVNVNQIYFTTGGYNITGGSTLVWGSGATVTSRSGTSTISAPQFINTGDGLKVNAGAGTVVFQGQTHLDWAKQLLVDGGKLVMNGSMTGPGNGVVYLAGGSISGTGSINVALAGSGRVNPGPSGTAAGIFTAPVVSPQDGLDFNFVFSGTAPNYGSAGDSVNDVLRLTGGTPFASTLTGSNTISVYFDNITDPSQLTLGAKFAGGIFTDADASFLSSVANSRRLYYAYGDGNGPSSFNGKNYYSLGDFEPGIRLRLGVAATTADFAGGSSVGQVMTFTVIVPEPSTWLLGLAGVVVLGGLRRQRRRR